MTLKKHLRTQTWANILTVAYERQGEWIGGFSRGAAMRMVRFGLLEQRQRQAPLGTYYEYRLTQRGANIVKQNYLSQAGR